MTVSLNRTIMTYEIQLILNKRPVMTSRLQLETNRAHQTVNQEAVS